MPQSPSSPIASALEREIGVTIKSSLLAAVEESPGCTHEAGRQYFLAGFKELGSRLAQESSERVFADFQAIHDAFPGEEAQEWTLSLTPRDNARAVVRAKEYGKSASDLVSLCVARGVGLLKEQAPGA